MPSEYLSLKASLAPMGSLSMSTDREDKDGVVVPAFESDASQELTVGAAVQYLFAFDRYFALGPQLGFSSWKSEAAAASGASRGLWVDLAVVPTLRLPLSGALEVYAALPVGLTLSIANELQDWVSRMQNLPIASSTRNEPVENPKLGTVEDSDPSFGLNVGLLLGARIAIAGDFGALIEIGYQRHQFSHTASVRFNRSPANMPEVLAPTEEGIDLPLGFVSQELRISAGVFF